MIQWLSHHFEMHKQRPPWNFFWRVWVENLGVIALFGGILVLIRQITGWQSDGAEGVPERSILKAIAGSAIMAPLVETIILQVLPVALCRRFTVGFWPTVFLSTALFAAPHFSTGLGGGICAGIVGGFYLAFTYVTWREKSFAAGFTMTAGSHALHNLVVIPLLFLSEPNQTPEPTRASAEHADETPGPRGSS